MSLVDQVFVLQPAKKLTSIRSSSSGTSSLVTEHLKDDDIPHPSELRAETARIDRYD